MHRHYPGPIRKWWGADSCSLRTGHSWSDTGQHTVCLDTGRPLVRDNPRWQRRLHSADNWHPRHPSAGSNSWPAALGRQRNCSVWNTASWWHHSRWVASWPRNLPAPRRSNWAAPRRSSAGTWYHRIRSAHRPSPSRAWSCSDRNLVVSVEPSRRAGRTWGTARPRSPLAAFPYWPCRPRLAPYCRSSNRQFRSTDSWLEPCSIPTPRLRADRAEP